MALISNIDCVEKEIISSGIIPLIDNKDYKISKSLCAIIIKSGCKIIEFGIRHKESINHYEKLSKIVRKESREVYFGAGTVIDIGQAEKIIEIGADFIISPGLDTDIAKLCHQNNIYYIPGCATVSEILKARKIGCELIKIFPINTLGGIKFLHTLKGPLPWLKAIPAGGIEADVTIVREWLNIGAAAVTIGSHLFNKDFKKETTLIEIETVLRDLLRD